MRYPNRRKPNPQTFGLDNDDSNEWNENYEYEYDDYLFHLEQIDATEPPTILTVSTNGDGNGKWNFGNLCGAYQLVPKKYKILINERRVWSKVEEEIVKENEQRFIVYGGERWTFKDNLLSSFNYLQSHPTNASYPPTKGYSFFDGEGYSDEDSNFNLTVTIGSPKYPDFVTLDANWSDIVHQYYSMGTYSMLPNITQLGRPVWKHEIYQRYLFMSQSYKWVIGDNYTTDGHYLENKRQGYMTLPEDEWQFWNGEEMEDFEESILELGRLIYPEAVTLNADWSAFDDQYYSMGTYRMLPNVTQLGRPVWKNEMYQRYLFMSQSFNWVVGDNYTTDYHNLRNKRQGIMTLPKDGWQFWNGDEMEDFEKSILSIGETVYPSSILIQDNHNDNITFEGFMEKTFGQYNQMEDQILNRRPVWKHVENERFLYSFDSLWLISDILNANATEAPPAGLISYRRGLVNLPQKWMYNNGTDWIIDDDDETPFIDLIIL